MNSRNTILVSVLLLLGALASAQNSTTPSGGTEQDSISALREELRQTREQLARSESEIRQLHGIVDRMQLQVEQLAAGPTAGTRALVQAEPDAQAQAPAPTSDEWQMLAAKVDEHEQAKVDSASKFRLKLSGLFLFTAFSNAGTVDNIDLPDYAYPRPDGAAHGNTGASLRQSIIGLTGIGPRIAGARTSADLQLDFFGGMPAGYSQYASGIARLRIARMRLDWENSSLVAGLDAPFFSPNSPTTYASVAQPAFSSSGNLWNWLPSIRFEQREKVGTAEAKIEAGLIDYAGYHGAGLSTNRYPTAGESSRQPAYALRLSLSRPGENDPVSVGIGGVYVPQRFLDGREVSGWGGTADFRVPVTAHFEMSGEFFTGRGINGFGGMTLGRVPAQDYHYATVTAPTIAELFTIGGWSQFKFKANSRNEFNAAAGYGGFSSSRLRTASITDSYLTNVPARNQAMFANYIYRPRSDLLFSVEYRHLRTFGTSSGPATADQVGVSAGFLF